MFTMGKASELPIRKDSIRFAILYRNGCTSNAWGVYKQKTGDAYISCRDNMKGNHISLHASGKQHIVTYLDSKGANDFGEKQFMNQWHEPEEEVPTFRLIFPWWGNQLNVDQHDLSTWRKNDIYIEGHHEFLTIVSFFIVAEEKTLRKKDGLPGFVLGEIPLRDGKKITLTAEWKDDPEFISVIKKGLQRISLEDFSDDDLKENLSMCMTGTSGSPNSVFMVCFPVTRRAG